MSVATTATDLTKRDFLRGVGAGTLLTLLGSDVSIPRRGSAATPGKASVTADEALQKLLDGNRRHLAGKLEGTRRLGERRREVAKGQQPFAIILGCSDSRVPPEIIFDHGLGDLFVVRVAGNIVHEPGLGSIEYAATHFGTPLIMVLGHARCGAVAATLEGGKAPGHVGSLVEAIRPAVEEVKGRPGDVLDLAVRANVRRVAARLRTSDPILAGLVKDGKLKVVGAHYGLDSGAVELVA